MNEKRFLRKSLKICVGVILALLILREATEFLYCYRQCSLISGGEAPCFDFCSSGSVTDTFILAGSILLFALL